MSRKSSANSLASSANSCEPFQEALSSICDPEQTSGVLQTHANFFNMLTDDKTDIRDLIFSKRQSLTDADWLQRLNLSLTKLTNNRDHLWYVLISCH